MPPSIPGPSQPVQSTVCRRDVLKEKLRQLIITQLEQERRTHQSAAELARDEAIHEESRPENKYDTHSQEAAYLAGAQARLTVELADAISVYRNLQWPILDASGRVRLGTLVKVESGGTNARYLLGPLRGGMRLQLADLEVMVITPQSPLGMKLMGARVGDRVLLPSGTARLLTVE